MDDGGLHRPRTRVVGGGFTAAADGAACLAGRFLFCAVVGAHASVVAGASALWAGHPQLAGTRGDLCAGEADGSDFDRACVYPVGAFVGAGTRFTCASCRVRRIAFVCAHAAERAREPLAREQLAEAVELFEGFVAEPEFAVTFGIVRDRDFQPELG